MKKDLSKRSSGRVLPWFLYFLLLLAIAFSALRLLFFFQVCTFHLEGHQPILVSKWIIPAMEFAIDENAAKDSTAISIRETIFLPDEALIFLKVSGSLTKADITCTYSSSHSPEELSPTSLEIGDDSDVWIVRCPLPPSGVIVSVAIMGSNIIAPGPTYKWDSLAYEAIVDDDNSTIVFVKGFNLRSGKPADSSMYKCIYGWDLSDSSSVLRSDAVSAAQEIIRCRTPDAVLTALHRFGNYQIKVSVKPVGKRAGDSVARLKLGRKSSPTKEHSLCVCTMLRNQARFLPEWVMYHARLGVDRWFIYDNNSDDDLENAVGSLVSANHNVTRHSWPWIKSQEAGFAHCALRARDSCQWVGFIDVDEFFHVPSNTRFSLQSVISKYTSKNTSIAEIRTWCRSFGPSGLKEHPEKGVTIGYTCRTATAERHKSIINPEALNSSLINVVHHFHLKPGYRHVTMRTNTLVINHYKYQVWEVFKEKFYRRVATYVSDWQEERNVVSKDRAPGLGTKAIEPVDWSRRFCEVNDTGLRDKVLRIFGDKRTGLLPWQTSSFAGL